MTIVELIGYIGTSDSSGVLLSHCIYFGTLGNLKCLLFSSLSFQLSDIFRLGFEILLAAAITCGGEQGKECLMRCFPLFNHNDKY